MFAQAFTCFCRCLMLFFMIFSQSKTIYWEKNMDVFLHFLHVLKQMTRFRDPHIRGRWENPHTKQLYSDYEETSRHQNTLIMAPWAATASHTWFILFSSTSRSNKRKWIDLPHLIHTFKVNGGVPPMELLYSSDSREASLSSDYTDQHCRL